MSSPLWSTYIQQRIPNTLLRDLSLAEKQILVESTGQRVPTQHVASLLLNRYLPSPSHGVSATTEKEVLGLTQFVLKNPKATTLSLNWARRQLQPQYAGLAENKELLKSVEAKFGKDSERAKQASQVLVANILTAYGPELLVLSNAPKLRDIEALSEKLSPEAF